MLTVAFDYGSRAEIARAAKHARRDILATGSGGVAGAITPHDLETHLYDPTLPPVDVLVRTSGETRISNFMLWQSAGARVYFTDCSWPDFGAAEIDEAIALARPRSA
ncbi:MAG: undecaprenyl diphosphate synthase family protein, partial [Ilumatobacteraceae bacterium]